MTAETPPPRPRCPVCGKPAQPATRPFCSGRCAQIDLGRWFGEQYRVPAPPGGEGEEEPPGSGSGSG